MSIPEPDTTSPAAVDPQHAYPLRGRVVLDLSRALAGPYAGMMLGDLGARVIKIESPGGDESRAWGPPFVDSEDGPISTYYLSCNRNKQSIALDLKDEGDLDVLRSMIRKADVLIENFRSGVMDRLGLSTRRLRELNPRLVVLSITGFGHDGSEAGRAGYDQIAQGESGLMSLTGSAPTDPQRVGVPITDLLSGIFGVSGVLAALLEREATGAGTTVRTSLLAAGVAIHAFQGARYLAAGQVPTATGNHHPSIAPYGLFACRDGAIQISVANDRLWRNFAAEFDIDPDDPQLAKNADRVRNHEQTRSAVERAFRDIDSDGLLERLQRCGIPAGRVRSLDEVYQWEQVRSQHLISTIAHPLLGDVRLPGSPLRFFAAENDDSERETTRSRHAHPPLLNEHGDMLREWAAT